MDFNTLLQAFGGTAGLALAAAIAYHFYRKTESQLPKAIDKIEKLESNYKDLSHELDKTKIELNMVEREVVDLKKREEEHYNEQKKKNDLVFNTLAKLEDLPKEIKELRSDLTNYFAKK